MRQRRPVKLVRTASPDVKTHGAREGQGCTAAAGVAEPVATLVGVHTVSGVVPATSKAEAVVCPVPGAIETTCPASAPRTHGQAAQYPALDALRLLGTGAAEA